MLYVATAHYRSPRWIEIQTRYLREHISVPFQTWASLELIDPSYGRHFDRVVEQLGSHSGKLNHLAMEILQEAADDDLLMFLDGDAFPIADPMPVIDEALARTPLVAVRRAENVDSPQPHPCFCVTSARLWRSLPGDWSGGPTWPGAQGWNVTDVGSLLMRKLEVAGLDWVQLLRSNRTNIDPLFFAVYGDIVYHHGAGFRAQKLSASHRVGAPDIGAPERSGPMRVLRAPLDRRRLAGWEEQTRERLAAESRRVYERIAAGGTDWLTELI